MTYKDNFLLDAVDKSSLTPASHRSVTQARTMNCQLMLALLFLVPVSIHAAPILNKDSYWECITQDREDKIWSATNSFQKVALNFALASCKKESKVPLSCKALKANCVGFNQGVSTTPMWQCSALDERAQSWKSNLYSQRDDAALAAEAYCKNKSTVPDTCYVHIFTCTNMNNGVE